MKTSEIDKLDDLLITKAFGELTPAEQEQFSHAGINEESYRFLRKLALESRDSTPMPVSPDVRRKLIHRFEVKNRHWALSILTAKVPAYLHIAALCMLATGLWYILPEKEVIIEKPIVVELPGRTDTLLLPAEPDTVYIEKYVRVKVPVYITAETPPKEAEPLKGTTLADQKEFSKLLVSTK